MKSWLEISAGRLRANYRAVQAVAGEDFEVLAVIKADAYGHGAELVAPVLCGAGATWLGITDVEEGVRVRRALDDAGFAKAELLVMCGMEPADAVAVVEHRLCPVVWQFPQILALKKAVQARGGSPIQVQIEVDTGMSRQGAVALPEIQMLLDAVAQGPEMKLAGILSHLCCSEVHACERTAEQERLFGEVQNLVSGSDATPAFWHLGNTSAVDEASTLEATRRQARRLHARPMVRVGLALFGYTLPIENGYEHRLEPHLRPVATWKTRILDVREIAPGSAVGYGASFAAKCPMRLALLPVGYADGFRRGASSGLGNGWVMIGGQKAPVVGRVSMNLTVVDVTGLEVGVGDEVVLLGEGVTAQDHAHWNHTIPYEILCGLRAHRRLS